MTTDPSRHMAQPSLPNMPNLSLRKYDPRTALWREEQIVSDQKTSKHTICKLVRCFPYPIRTLSAPRGVTRIAGANAYAAKLATSPMATRTHSVSLSFYSNRQGLPSHTCNNTAPPDGTLQIGKPLAFKPMSFRGLHQTLPANRSVFCASKWMRIAKDRTTNGRYSRMYA